MITDYKIICSRVSEKLGISEEEVIRQVEEYSDILIKKIREYEVPFFDFFGIATMRLLPYKLESMIKNNYFEAKGIPKEQIELLLKKAQWIEDNNCKIRKDDFIENGLPLSQEELNRREKEILNLCKSPQKLGAIKKLGYPFPFPQQFLNYLVAKGKLKLTGQRNVALYTTN